MTPLLASEEVHEQSTARMAESVTRHAQITDSEEYKFLLCGIDSLDLGFYVNWGPDWKNRVRRFDLLKVRAQTLNKELLVGILGKKIIFKPGGKSPNYRFHLACPGYHLFIAKTASGEKSPNLYASINSETLWSQKIEEVVGEIAGDVKAIGNGTIKRIQVSRCDIAADFQISGGLSLEFLNTFRVSRSRKIHVIKEDNTLETFYVGSKKAPIQLRLYDKAKEVLKNAEKLWFKELWGVETIEDIWRIEFQLRRPALKQFRVDTIAELPGKIGGIWKALTESWFSLRLPDNENTYRRSIHRFWEQVRECSERLGPSIGLKRDFSAAKHASMEWYLSRLEGILAGMGAISGQYDCEGVLKTVTPLLKRRPASDFKEKCFKKAINLGLAIQGGVR